MRTGALLALGLALTLAWATPGTAQTGSFPPHRGGSPWSFTAFGEPSSTFVVNDTDSATIDVFQFREDGPIEIDLRIRRFVGKTDADGRLLNLDALIERGIVGPKVAITLPVFDVDHEVFPEFDCDGDGVVDQLLDEVDEIYLNDELLGTLRGQNQVWVSNSFSVPVSELRFPSAPGETAVNRIRVEIDTANRDVVLSGGGTGCVVWAVAIDWIAVRYEAASPVVMVHGADASSAAFDEFRQGLHDEGIWAQDSSIDLDAASTPDPLPTACEDVFYNNSIQYDVFQLRNLVPAIARRFGSESLHFVTHSKGGLDTRGFLSSTIARPIQVQVGTMGGQAVRRELVGRSLITLNTPHRGSVLADYGVEARQLTQEQVANSSLEVAIARQLEGPQYCDTTPARAISFVTRTSLPTGVQAASVATDADCDGDGAINLDDTCDAAGRREYAGFTGGIFSARRLYQLLGSVASVDIRVVPGAPGEPDEVVVSELPTPGFRGNDLVVTRHSAGLYPLYGIDSWHHMNVHSRENARILARDAQKGGLVDWRKR